MELYYKSKEIDVLSCIIDNNGKDTTFRTIYIKDYKVIKIVKSSNITEYPINPIKPIVVVKNTIIRNSRVSRISKKTLMDLNIKFGSKVVRRLINVRSTIFERCNNPKHISYKYYGAKGIDLCDSWKKDITSFITYLHTLGYDDLKYGVGRDMLTLDRLDNNKDYEPGNITFNTREGQAKNRG